MLPPYRVDAVEPYVAPSERTHYAGGGGLHLHGCQDDERDEEGLHGLALHRATWLATSGGVDPKSSCARD